MNNTIKHFAIFLLVSVVLLVSASALTAGPNNAGTGTDVTYGDTAWSNPGNIVAVGTPYATVTLSPGDDSHYLQATNYSFNIPAGATINGIQVVINRSGGQSLGYGFRDQAVYLVKNNVVQTSGNNKATGTTWPTSFTTATYGSANDLWGLSWAPVDINNANFGVALSAHSNLIVSTKTATVDYMQITVTYTPPVSSCTCPGVNTNWAIDLSEHCVLNANCNIGTGNLSFINTGYFTINATLNTSNFAAPPANSIIWITSNGRWY